MKNTADGCYILFRVNWWLILLSTLFKFVDSCFLKSICRYLINKYYLSELEKQIIFTLLLVYLATVNTKLIFDSILVMHPLLSKINLYLNCCFFM